MSTKSKNKSKKRRNSKSNSNPVVAIIIVIALLVCTITAVKVINSPKRHIKATISTMQNAYNSADLDSMVACFEPKVQKLYSSANSLLGSFTGMDLSTVTSLLPFASYLDEESDGDSNSTLPEMNITVESIEMTSNTTATVNCIVKFGDLDPEQTTIDMVKVDKQWYIAVGSLF